MLRRAACLVGAVGALTVFAAGCGGSDRDPAEDRADIRAALQELQRAVVNDRPAAACRHITRKVHRQIGRAGHGKVADCETDLAEVLEVISQAEDRTPRVTRVVVTGDEAVATVGTRRAPISVPLRHEDGAWKLDNFFGADTVPPFDVAARPDAPSAYATGPDQQPAPPGEPVSASAGRSRCPDVREVDLYRVTGGCQARVAGGPIEMVIRTVAGSFRLVITGCTMKGELRVDGAGRLFVDEVALARPDGGLCLDTFPCASREREPAPWAGQVEAVRDGRLAGAIEVCIATCVGRFKGRAPVELVRRQGAWRLAFRDAPMGAGGMLLDGSLKVGGAPLQISET